MSCYESNVHNQTLTLFFRTKYFGIYGAPLICKCCLCPSFVGAAWYPRKDRWSTKYNKSGAFFDEMEPNINATNVLSDKKRSKRNLVTCQLHYQLPYFVSLDEFDTKKSAFGPNIHQPYKQISNKTKASDTRATF